jgi:hypothetical protein
VIRAIAGVRDAFLTVSPSDGTRTRVDARPGSLDRLCQRALIFEPSEARSAPDRSGFRLPRAARAGTRARMRNLLGIFFFAITIGAAGCGASQHGAGGHDEHAGCEHCKPGERGEDCDHCKHGKHGEREKQAPAMAGPVGELHAVLAPVWHSAPGAGRAAKACEQAQALRERAAAVSAAPPPEGASPERAAATKDLVTAADALVAACAAEGKPEVEAKLSTFHDAFHKVAELSGHGGRHEGHDGREGHEGHGH